MKICAIVEARMTSSRLPGKVLMKPDDNNTFFEILIKRLYRVKELSSIILATTTNKADDKLVKKAKNLNLKVFRGSEYNVVNRVLNAAKKFNAEIILGITADCPLIDPYIVSNAIQMYLNNDIDYVSNGHVRSFPDGMDCQVFSLKTLKRSYALIKTELEKEHLGLVIRNNRKKFRKFTLIAPRDLYWPELGLTLDEYDDYIFLKRIINHFGKDYKFSCHDIISFLKKNKKLLKINSHVIRKGDN